MIDETKYWTTAVNIDFQKCYESMDVLAAIRLSRVFMARAVPYWHLAMISRMKHMDTAREYFYRGRSRFADWKPAGFEGDPTFKWVPEESVHWAELEADKIEQREAESRFGRGTE